MDMNEFNKTVVKSEDSEHIYFDLRPFGNRQGEAMDSYLHDALVNIQAGISNFGKREVVLLTDASTVIPSSARTWLASFQQAGVSVSVECRRA